MKNWGWDGTEIKDSQRGGEGLGYESLASLFIWVFFRAGRDFVTGKRGDQVGVFHTEGILSIRWGGGGGLGELG